MAERSVYTEVNHYYCISILQCIKSDSTFHYNFLVWLVRYCCIQVHFSILIDLEAIYIYICTVTIVV